MEYVGKASTHTHGKLLHRRELSVLHYYKIMAIYPNSFLVVTTQLLSWIIFINDSIYVYQLVHLDYIF